MIDAKKALDKMKVYIPLDYTQWGSRVLVILACAAWAAKHELHSRKGYRELVEMYGDRIGCRPEVLHRAIRGALEVSDFPFTPAETVGKMVEVLEREN